MIFFAYCTRKDHQCAIFSDPIPPSSFFLRQHGSEYVTCGRVYKVDNVPQQQRMYAHALNVLGAAFQISTRQKRFFRTAVQTPRKSYLQIRINLHFVCIFFLARIVVFFVIQFSFDH